MVMAPPGGDFASRSIISAQPDIDLAKRRQSDAARTALEQWARQQAMELEQERLQLIQYKQGLQNQLASIEQTLDRGARMATNPHSANYARGGVVPRFAEGGTTDYDPIGYAPNGTAIYRDVNGQFYYIDAQGAVAFLPKQLENQILWGSPQAPTQTTLTWNPPPGPVAPSAPQGPIAHTPPGGIPTSSAPPMPPTTSTTNGLVAPTPDQWSQEYKDAIAARERAQAAAQREQAQSFAYSEASQREAPAYSSRSYRPYAAGGEVPPEMMAGPPMPPMGNQGNAVTGEGMDNDQTYGGEVVMVPTGQPGMYQVSYTEGPRVSSLPGGTLIVPLPPHLDEQFRAELPPLPGDEAQLTDDGGYAAGGQVYAHGGMVGEMNYKTMPGLPPLPPVSPFAGIDYAAVPQNLQQFGGLSQTQMNRMNQGMIASGDLEGIEGRRRKLLNYAPGQGSLGTWSG